MRHRLVGQLIFAVDSLVLFAMSGKLPMHSIELMLSVDHVNSAHYGIVIASIATWCSTVLQRERTLMNVVAPIEYDTDPTVDHGLEMRRRCTNRRQHGRTDRLVESRCELDSHARTLIQ